MKKTLLLALAAACLSVCPACASGRTGAEDSARKMQYRGFIGGMMLHTGYAGSSDLTIMSPGGESRTIGVRGAPFGIGGAIRFMFGKHLIHLNNTFFFFDTIGLALFTVVGVGKSLSLGYPFWVAIIMGSMTGAAGGVIRDVFINEIPLIFRKEIYAVACVVGGLVYWVCALAQVDDYICQIACGIVVFLTRILAVKYKICLPTLSGHA